jgi:hypothetical protein
MRAGYIHKKTRRRTRRSLNFRKPHSPYSQKFRRNAH